MKSKKIDKIILFLLLFFLIIVLSLIVAVTFSDGSVIPNWKTFSGYLDISPPAVSVQDDDYFRIIDVGQGDCMLFCSNGQTALVDTGTEDYSANLYPKFQKYGVEKIDLLIISHIHDDHTGGIASVAKRFDIKNLIIPRLTEKENGYEHVKSIRNTVRKNSGLVYTAVQGMTVNVGDFEITVLAYFDDEEDENNRSLFLMAKIGGKKILLTGDAESSAEKRLLEENLKLSCNILKVGHHGSGTSSSKEFLEECSPDYAVISCGLGNVYGHPHGTTLERLETVKSKILRTDIQGDITFCFKDGKCSVSTER